MRFRPRPSSRPVAAIEAPCARRSDQLVLNPRATRTWLRGVSALVLAASVAQGQSLPPGVSLESLTYAAPDSVWVFRYVAANPDRRYGVSQIVEVDAWAPGRVGSPLLSMPQTDFIGDATQGTPSEAGHVALAVESPSAAWSVVIDEAAVVRWRMRGDATTIRFIVPGQSVRGFIIRARGVPLLRDAALVPFEPIPSYPDGDTDKPPVYHYPPGTWAGESIQSVVPGPGVPVEVLSSAVEYDQIDLACRAGFISAANCKVALALLEVPSQTRASFDVRKVSSLLGGPSGVVHPYVAATILRQLQLLRRPRPSANP